MNLNYLVEKKFSVFFGNEMPYHFIKLDFLEGMTIIWLYLGIWKKVDFFLHICTKMLTYFGNTMIKDLAYNNNCNYLF